MKVLVIDVGGNHVKILATGQDRPRRFASGPGLSAKQMAAGARRLAKGWHFDAVAIGYPGVVVDGRPAVEPRNLGKGWVDFDYAAAFGCPVKIINDAAMQAMGSYRQGKLLFLGLGTGLGTAMVVDGVVVPMELAHLPYRDSSFEDHVGRHALQRDGKKRWRRRIADVVAKLSEALQPDEVVLGGGKVRFLKQLPPLCRAGDNANAFIGGFRMWTSAQGMSTKTAFPPSTGAST